MTVEVSRRWSAGRDGTPAKEFSDAVLARRYELRDGERIEPFVAALARLLEQREGYVATDGREVARLAREIGERLGLEGRALADLSLAARLHDIGKIGVPDRILQKEGQLNEEEQALLQRHVQLGAQTLAALPGLERVAEIVRSHHERWDGEGYPIGTRGAEIPPESRIVAVCDAYRSLMSDRPARRALPEGKALAVVLAGAGTLFDPQVVDCLVELLAEDGITPSASFRKPVAGIAPTRGGSRMWSALERLDSLPVLAEARHRLLEVLREPNPSSNKIVEAVEGDVALTSGVLRVANAGARQSKGSIGSLPDAVGTIGPQGAQLVLARLPVADFFDGMSGWPLPPGEFRSHALAVRRSARALARATGFAEAEELAVAALLHDVGKLVLAASHDDYPRNLDLRKSSPEDRVRAERRDLGLDHASVGALALRRWSLPESIARAVEDHHNPEAGGMGAMLRLADMLAHFSHGAPTTPRSLTEAASAVGMDDATLRSLAYESAGDRWDRRASSEPSPLTPQETLALRGLAEGKLYKQIADGMGLSPSTVRSHLHRAYGKLGVADRAQAVLMASDRGWI